MLAADLGNRNPGATFSQNRQNLALRKS
jgi:hypothetical protein